MTICTGMSLLQQDPLQPLDIAEQQGGALVGGEAAREADGEGVGIEHFAGAPHLRSDDAWRRSADGVLALAHEGDQAALAPAVHFQQFLVGNVFHLLPDARDR